MGSSTSEGYIAHAAAMFGDQYPISAALYLETLDSALHLLDEYAQVRVNWPVHGGASAYKPAAAAVVSTWYPLDAYAFPIAIRSDGSSFRLRVRLTGAMSTAQSGTFRAVLSSAVLAREYANLATADVNTYEASTSATTPTVLTPTTDVIYMTADMVRDANAHVRTYDAVSSASPVSVAICDAVLSIWGQTSNAAAKPYLYGVNAAEYIGA